MALIDTYHNQFSFARIVERTEGMHESAEGRLRWLEIRKGYIGGSEAAAALGLSRYQSKVELYYSKTEQTPDFDNEKMWAGRMMEPVIAEMFAQRVGKDVLKQPFFYCHPQHSFMGANIDFGILGENAGLECKNTTNRIDFADGQIPDEYYLQCQHYMCVTGAEKWYLAYLLDGWQFKHVEIPRDDALIEMLIEGETAFWMNHVNPRVPPAFDGSASSARVLRFLYPSELKEPHEPVELPGDVDAMWEEENEITAQIGMLEKRKDELRNQIAALIGEKAVGISPKYAFTYKTVNRGGYAVEPSSYRQLRGRKCK